MGWDDADFVTQNPWLRPLRLSGLFEFWLKPYRQVYSPIFFSSYALDIAISGFAPFTFHFINILLHTICGIFVFLFIRRILHAWLTPRAPAIAILFASWTATMLFLVHPLRVESVAWISSRKDVLSGAFAAIAVWAYIEYCASSRQSSRARHMYAASVIAFVLAGFSKSIVIGLPIALFAIDVWIVRSSTRMALLRAIPFLIISLIVAIATAVAQPTPEYIRSFAAWKRLMVAGYGLAFYAFKFVLPIHLSPVYGITPERIVSHPVNYAMAAIAIVAVAVLIYLRRTRVSSAFALSQLLPILGFIPFVYQFHSAVSDRYTYFAAVGVSLGVAPMLVRVTRPSYRAVVLLILVVLAVLSWRQCRIWRDSQTLWSYTVQVSPESATAQGNYGAVLIDAKQPEQGRDHLRRAIELDPHLSDAYVNLATIDLKDSRFSEALSFAQKAVELNARSLNGWSTLGAALLRLNRYDEARAALDRALALSPSSPAANQEMALLLKATGHPDEALGYMETSVKIQPTAFRYEWLGDYNAERGQSEQAIENYERSLAINPAASAVASKLQHLRAR